MALGESGDWASATSRIVKMVNGEADPLEGALPEGYGSARLLERFARQFEADYGVELGMSIPTLLAGFSGALQGGFQVPIVRTVNPAPQFIWVSTVVQFIGIAEAGQQKSTLLDEVLHPLKRALDRDAVASRRQTVENWRKEAMDAFGATGVAVDAEAGAWDKVYLGGVCPSSLTDQGTPEGIRNNLVRHGGHRVILTAEPDVLRDVSAYASKGAGGSVGLFLRGWNQEDLMVDRAGTDALVVREPSLPCVIMLQPDSFKKYTGGSDGSDDFVDRGVFSRMLLWRAEKTPESEEFPDLDDLVEWDPSAPVATVLGSLREKLEDRMTTVAMRSNDYRISKGLEQAWKESKYLWMPTPKEVQRERLSLDGLAGIKAGIRVQQMRAAVINAVRAADAVNPGIAAVLEPLAQRLSAHVMRMAGIFTLADDPGATTVDTGHVIDVATRLMPWLWAGWWQVMRERLEANAQASVSEGLLKNAKGADLTGGNLLLKVLSDLDASNGPAAMGGFTPSEVIKKVENRMPHAQRGGALRGHLRNVLAGMAAEGLVSIVGQASDATGKPSARYRITEAGRAMVKQ